jgi:hypothetical protein
MIRQRGDKPMPDYEKFSTICPQIAQHLGDHWRAVFPEQNDQITRTHPTRSIDLCGPHGWQLYLYLDDGDRIRITGCFAGKSLYHFVGNTDGYQMGVSLHRHPRAIANDIKRRLLTAKYPELFELAKKRAQQNAREENNKQAVIATLMSLDPRARFGYWGDKDEIWIFGQSITVHSYSSGERVDFERLRVTPEQAVLIFKIIAPEATRKE